MKEEAFIYMLFALAVLFSGGCSKRDLGSETPLTLGSKVFTESVLLSEIAKQTLEKEGVHVEHRAELGGTRVLFSALQRGEIDAYPEYTGTLREELLPAMRDRSFKQLRQQLKKMGIGITATLGFSNGYGLAMRRDRSRALGIRRISDLRTHPGLRIAVSNEFLDRADGFHALRDAYALSSLSARGVSHAVAYQGLVKGNLDLTDIYTTDGELAAYNLQVLDDDRGFFTVYEAVFLWRLDLEKRNAGALRGLKRLEASISQDEMIAMNRKSVFEKVPEHLIAASFVGEGSTAVAALSKRDSRSVMWKDVGKRTLEHLALVGWSLLAAILFAIPLGIWSSRSVRGGQFILAAVSIVQTIPSLVLLVLMIPLFGIGGFPAIVALFLYSLLPIVRNTHEGLRDIPAPLQESALALGLPAFARLRLVEVPMASPAILAGIKTSAIINIGTATLGALIGAGGYGQPILTGIRLNDVGLILQGAIPAALLALFVQAAFELVARWVIPRGLRLGDAG